jgi:predicted TPR repeat methyltransferase
MAEFLAGVDLSSRMIAKARERRIYDLLRVGNIEDALREEEPRYDLIIAGDVFTYVGDLAKVLAGCARVLQPQGLVIFSVETATGEGYQLRPTGRYAHTADYIDKTAGVSGMTVVHRRDMVLRNDPGPIPGRILVLSKAG